MRTRSLPSHDLTLIDEGPLTLAGLHAATFHTEDGLGVVVSFDPDNPASEAFHLSITRPGVPPSDDDMEHLQRLGLARLERRWDPDRGDLVRVDLRPIQWCEERRRLRAREDRRDHPQHDQDDTGVRPA